MKPNSIGLILGFSTFKFFFQPIYSDYANCAYFDNKKIARKYSDRKLLIQIGLEQFFCCINTFKTVFGSITLVALL